jgi:hypothetical protein
VSEAADPRPEDRPSPSSSPPPRKAGVWRVVAFFVMAGACVLLGHPEIAPLFAALGVVVWWIDRGIGKPPPGGGGASEG